MTPQEQYNLVLSFARVLYVNGQATEQTVAKAQVDTKASSATGCLQVVRASGA
jgi:hypothetical protein